MTKFFVLDAGVLFSDWVKKKPESTFATTIGILEELNNRPSLERAESLISVGRLIIESVDDSKIEQARKASEKTGDSTVLSKHDLELIGLALQRMDAGFDVVLVSTDLALLNTSKHLGLEILDPENRMQHAIQWMQKCPACGRISTDSSEIECIVCGTKMKRKTKSRRQI
ncbi:MAG: hypothetical protein ACFFED_13600 [Candidatus Thorarchaeota archaeon]